MSHQSDWVYYKEPIKFPCCKGKWYVRRFSPDIVKNGHIYSSIKEEEVFIYWASPTFSVGYAEDFGCVFDNHSQLDNQSEKDSDEHAMAGLAFPIR